jgi:hypothetical protein
MILNWSVQQQRRGVRSDARNIARNARGQPRWVRV